MEFKKTFKQLCKEVMVQNNLPAGKYGTLVYVENDGLRFVFEEITEGKK